MRTIFDKFRYYILLAPLLLFIICFFLWPLLTVAIQSVSDPIMGKALPNTKIALSHWDGENSPGRDAEIALMRDIAAINDNQLMGEVVRRLNSNQAGFRTLMSKTITAVQDSNNNIEQLNLGDIDKRWQEPRYWRAIVKALPSWTDQFLLSALDRKRDASGNIITLPSDQSANIAIMWRTLWVSLLVVGGCILIGLPYAMVMASLQGWKRQVMLMSVLIPLWTSLLVRTSAWYVILQDSGLINTTLMNLGLINQPIHLLFNRVGVIIAMVHVLLPFMVLPIFSVLIAIPRNLMPAASSLGASPIRAFLHVLLPLSLRGVASGGLLVFISAIGYYITPALIGGAADQMISSIIAFYALNSANWNMASALGVILLLTTLILYTFYARIGTEKKAR